MLRIPKQEVKQETPYDDWRSAYKEDANRIKHYSDQVGARVKRVPREEE